MQRPLAEAVLHALERLKEGDRVLHDLGADDPRDGPQERLRGDVDGLQVRTRRHHQQAEEAVVEETGESPRRVEEVERVPRRRRVDDDEVEAALLV